MDKPKREPPEAGKPLTRDDVLRLMEEHRLTEVQRIEQLHLIEEQPIDEQDLEPRSLDLRHANLRQADLSGLDLNHAYLSRTNHDLD